MCEFKKKGYNATELRRINTCRQYLQVIYLSDITNARGNEIDTGYYHETRHDSAIHWSNVPYPPEITWNTWRKAVQTTFVQTNTPHKLKSEYLLGNWMKPIDSLQKQWKHSYSEMTNSIYTKEG